jgi:hypothetical protein
MTVAIEKQELGETAGPSKAGRLPEALAHYESWIWLQKMGRETHGYPKAAIFSGKTW